ncbi:hypothetical protein HDV02_006122 [Globomyces sp. JEL0801]|nr:hypothetical protein HDV02_006122 [Globomyces sp. JEL0801]
MANQLPRAKPIPKMRPATRWEKFAAAKGIRKVKKKRVVYDEAMGEYRPTYGYKNAGKTTKDLSDWAVEVPDHDDGTKDVFQEKRDAKKEKVAKNAMQQRRNQEEAHASTSGKDYKAFRKQLLRKQIVDSKISTASLGKFDRKLENDNVKIKGTRRKFESNTISHKEEKEKALDIAEKIGRPKTGKSEISVRKAVKYAKAQKTRK